MGKKIFLWLLLIVLALGSVAVITRVFIPDSPTVPTESSSEEPSKTETQEPSQSETEEPSQNESSTVEPVEPQEPEEIIVSNAEELSSALENAEDGAVISIPTSFSFRDTLVIEDKSITLAFTEEATGEEISLELKNGEIRILNGQFNGIDIAGEGTLVLDNVSSVATVNGDSGVSLAEGAVINMEIVGETTIIGAVNGDGIEVPEGTTLNLSGEKLVVKGNAGVEYSSYDNYGTTDDAALEGSGSGIGDAYHGIGVITIDGVQSLTAEGYGLHAYGIGGGNNATITIKNSTIEYARGGFATTEFYHDTKYGVTDLEGGCAIGVGIDDGNTGKIILDNVTVNGANGGSKSAAIGASYWCGVEIEITDCTLISIIGGNSSAGIGGSRVREDNPFEQVISIKIVDSIVDSMGGTYGSGIGNGYDTNCSSTPSLCHIEISGNSEITAKGGKYGAGIGTGFHTGNLTGFIAEGVVVTAQRGDVDFYKDAYTTAQDIGYGVVDPSRDFLNEEVTFTVAGEVIQNPVELISAE